MPDKISFNFKLINQKYTQSYPVRQLNNTDKVCFTGKRPETEERQKLLIELLCNSNLTSIRNTEQTPEERQKECCDYIIAKKERSLPRHGFAEIHGELPLCDYLGIGTFETDANFPNEDFKGNKFYMHTKILQDHHLRGNKRPLTQVINCIVGAHSDRLIPRKYKDIVGDLEINTTLERNSELNLVKVTRVSALFTKKKLFEFFSKTKGPEKVDILIIADGQLLKPHEEF